MVVGTRLVDSPAVAGSHLAGNLVVADNHPVDSPAVAGSHLAGNLAVADNHPVDSRLVVVRSLVDSPAVADSRLVAQVDWDPVPGSDSMTSILPHFFPPDIDEFTMKDKRIDCFTRF
jgi:hypothetical protein